MGQSTKLHVNNFKYRPEDIKELLINQYNVSDVENFVSANSSGYYTLQFKLNKKNRQLNVFTNSQVGGFPCMTLDLASDPDSTELFKSMGSVVGGIFVESDYEDKSVIYEDSSNENLEFLVKKAQLSGIDSTESFINYLKKHKTF